MTFNRSIVVLSAALGLCVLAACAASLSTPVMPRSPMAIVHFTPFDVETFAPLTMSNIEVDANCHWRMQVNEIDQLLSKDSDAELVDFDNAVVRLSVQYDNGNVIYVDRDGVLIHSVRDQGVRLSPADLRALNVRLRDIARLHGCEFA